MKQNSRRYFSRLSLLLTLSSTSLAGCELHSEDNSPGASAAEAQSVMVLDAPGETVELQDHFEGRVVIEGDNITLDCKNHALFSSAVTEIPAITAHGNNIAVKNCSIVGNFRRGIMLFGDDTVLDSNRFEHPSTGEKGTQLPHRSPETHQARLQQRHAKVVEHLASNQLDKLQYSILIAGNNVEVTNNFTQYTPGFLLLVAGAHPKTGASFSDVVITGNHLSGGNAANSGLNGGVFVTGGSNNFSIRENSISGPIGAGLYVNAGTDLSVSNNTLTACREDGIYLSDIQNGTVAMNHVTDAAASNIAIYQSDAVTLSGNSTIAGSFGGMRVSLSSNVRVTDNSIVGHHREDGGLLLDRSTGVTNRDALEGNLIENNTGAGVTLAPANNWDVAGNTIVNNAPDVVILP